MEKNYESIEKLSEPGFEQRAALIKNILLFLCMLVVVASLSGILGYGYWTKKTKGQMPALKVEHELFLRVGRPTPLEVFTEIVASDTLLVGINRTMFNKISFKEVIPKPFKMAVGKEMIYFYFIQQGRGPKKIQFNCQAERAGSVNTRISANGQEISFKQFIYP